MSKYSNNNKEKTHTIKNKKKTSIQKLITTYLTIWTLSVAAFWVFKDVLDALGYSIMVFGIILPVTTLVISFFIGKNEYFGKWKWLFIILSGIMYMLAAYVTFSTANMVAFDKFNIPDFSAMKDGAIISVIGMGIGTGIRIVRKKITKA